MWLDVACGKHKSVRLTNVSMSVLVMPFFFRKHGNKPLNSVWLTPSLENSMRPIVDRSLEWIEEAKQFAVVEQAVFRTIETLTCNMCVHLHQVTG